MPRFLCRGLQMAVLELVQFSIKSPSVRGKNQSLDEFLISVHVTAYSNEE